MFIDKKRQAELPGDFHIAANIFRPRDGKHMAIKMAWIDACLLCAHHLSKNFFFNLLRGSAQQTISRPEVPHLICEINSVSFFETGPHLKVFHSLIKVE